MKNMIISKKEYAELIADRVHLNGIKNAFTWKHVPHYVNATNNKGQIIMQFEDSETNEIFINADYILRELGYLINPEANVIYTLVQSRFSKGDD